MKYNKGEWSEGYVLLRLLVEGKINAADQNLDKLAGVCFPIIKILRFEEETLGYYPGNVVLVNEEETDENILELPVEQLAEMSRIMYEEIKKGKKSFEIPVIEEFLNSMEVFNLKAKSADKKDITIKVHDTFTGHEPTLGFSIKSQIGAKPTLFNVSKSTNFIYKIVGAPLEDYEIEKYDSLEKVKKTKVKEILDFVKDSGRKLEFVKVQGDVFMNNLYLIDSSLPKILSEMVLYYFRGKAADTKDILKRLQKKNPCNYSTEHNHPFYEYKVKSYLTDVALGMTSQTVWNGKYDADGGYIIVKPDGEILCYYVYNRNMLQEYLVKGTKFDSPSRSKFDYGYIYEQDGEHFIKLNAQIRFK